MSTSLSVLNYFRCFWTYIFNAFEGWSWIIYLRQKIFVSIHRIRHERKLKLLNLESELCGKLLLKLTSLFLKISRHKITGVTESYCAEKKLTIDSTYVHTYVHTCMKMTGLRSNFELRTSCMNDSKMPKNDQKSYFFDYTCISCPRWCYVSCRIGQVRPVVPKMTASWHFYSICH
jgi:hypothetical protein